MIPSSDQIASASSPQLVTQPRAEREAPGGVHTTAVRRQHAQSPVADLVAEALDDDGAIRRDHARGVLLLAQERLQVARGELVEVVVGRQLRGLHLQRAAREPADLDSKLLRPADRVAVPEGDRTGCARRGGHDHAVAADLLDPPGRRAEQEGLARPRLVDHLLVQLADAAPVRQDDGEEAAVGDRPRVDDRQPARALARADRAADAIPDDPRTQLCELRRRVAPVEHVEHVLQQRAGQLGVGVRSRDQREQLVDRDRLIVAGRSRDRDDLLGEHVECVARDDGRLDSPLTHQPRDDGALQQVGAVLREDAALARVADVVPGAADALQPARHRLGRLDLEHEVDRAHVDAELETAGRDQARQRPGLELLLDERALLA